MNLTNLVISDAKLPEWLDLLRAVLPPRNRCLVVGAGAGNGPLLRWMAQAGVPAILLEADPTTFQHLARNTPPTASWELRNEVVTSTLVPQDFHVASHLPESGLLRPEELGHIWPNLRTQACLTSAKVTGMAGLVADNNPNWLVVDCLPASALLQGSDLSGVHLLMARVLLDEQAGLDDWAGLSALRRLLERSGLRLAACLEERHPALGLAIFVRDVQAQQESLDRFGADLAREAEEKKEADRSKAEALVRCQQLSNDAATLIAQRDAEAHAKEQALAHCEQLANDATDLQTQRDSEAEAKAKAVARCEQLVKEVAILQAQKDADAIALAQALAHCEQLAKEAAELQAQRDAEAQAKAQAMARCEQLAMGAAQAVQFEERLLAHVDRLATTLDASVQRELSNAVTKIERTQLGSHPSGNQNDISVASTSHSHPMALSGGDHLTLSKLIVVTPSCRANDANRRAIEATWGETLRRRGVRHFYVIGAPQLDRSCRMGNILYVPCRDDYESLLLKLSLAYEYLLDTESEFTHILKLDDDCYLNIYAFERSLHAAPIEWDYIAGAIHVREERINRRWHFGKCSDPRFDQEYPSDTPPASYAKGGYGYLLSKRALAILIQHIPVFSRELQEFTYSYEDLRIGHILKEEGIAPNGLPEYKVAAPGATSVIEHSVVYNLSEISHFFRYHQELAVTDLSRGQTQAYLSLATPGKAAAKNGAEPAGSGTVHRPVPTDA